MMSTRLLVDFSIIRREFMSSTSVFMVYLKRLITSFKTPSYKVSESLSTYSLRSTSSFRDCCLLRAIILWVSLKFFSTRLFKFN
jgi:hypothetical protein